MAEDDGFPKSVRIHSDGLAHGTIATDLEGKPLPEPLTGICFQHRPNVGNGMPLVALEFMIPRVDIIADVATLDRLQLAEEACNKAEAFVRRFYEWYHRQIETGKRLEVDGLCYPASDTKKALEEWRETAGAPHSRHVEVEG